MDGQIFDVVTEWQTVPVNDGADGLAELADREFTGVATDGTTLAFFLNGRAISVVEGSIEDLTDASFTARRAPDDSLPLLLAMRAGDNEVRGKYYTEDTPLSEVDGTLRAGNFTGFVELSENVLSGDYYVVYSGGRALPVAFVGNNRQMLTDDEAFERADDEVGIYTVTEASIEVVDLPVDESPDTASPASDENPTDEELADENGPDEQSGDGAAERTTDSVEENESDALEGSVSSDETNGSAPVDDDAESVAVSDDADETDAATSDPETNADVAADGSTADAPAEANGAGEPPDTEVTFGGATADGESSAEAGEDPVFAEEAEWREAKIIPSLAPDQTSTSEARASASTDDASERRETRAPDAGAGRANGDVERLREELSAAESAREEAETRAAELESELDDSRAEIDRLEARVEELTDEIERLESEVTRLETAPEPDEAAETSVGTSMSAEEALSGTSLFVRYQSKGGATLETAHAGKADRSAVSENLRLEHHTTFDSDAVAVDGEPFDAFLRDTVEYGFVRWVVGELLYEIRETGNQGALEGMYDAIPEIDRIELSGSVSIAYVEDGTEHREQQTFDVVLRDRMGNVLAIADINDTRDATTEEMLGSFIQGAKRLSESVDSFGSAFSVAASFFDPSALETASEETGSGLLSRSKRKSFVKLSRKRGFHLCLVEARHGDYHVNVPEL